MLGLEIKIFRNTINNRFASVIPVQIFFILVFKDVFDANIFLMKCIHLCWRPVCNYRILKLKTWQHVLHYMSSLCLWQCQQMVMIFFTQHWNLQDCLDIMFKRNFNILCKFSRIIFIMKMVREVSREKMEFAKESMRFSSSVWNFK